MLLLKRETVQFSNPEEKRALLETAEEVSFIDSRRDVKSILAGSKIDREESLSFWHSSADGFSPWGDLAAICHLCPAEGEGGSLRMQGGK